MPEETAPPLVAGPVMLHGEDLVVAGHEAYLDSGDVIPGAPGSRTHRLPQAHRRVLAELLRRAGELVPAGELLKASGDDDLTAERLARSCVKALRDRLPATFGARVDIVVEADGFRLVVDDPAEHLAVGPLALHPSASWCWVGRRSVRLLRRAVPLLAALMRSHPAAVPDEVLCGELQVLDPKREVSSLRKALTENPRDGLDLLRADGGYLLVVDDPSERLRLGPLAFRPGTPWCWVMNARVDLSPGERRMLLPLLRAKNTIVPMADLCAGDHGAPTDARHVRDVMSLLEVKLPRRSERQLELLSVDGGYMLRATVLRVGALALDTRRRVVTIDDRPIRLAGELRELLTALMRHGVEDELDIDGLVALGAGDATTVERRLGDLDADLRAASRGAVRVTVSPERVCTLIVGRR